MSTSKWLLFVAVGACFAGVPACEDNPDQTFKPAPAGAADRMPLQIDVYEAVDRTVGASVALKLLRPEIADRKEAVERLQEYRTALITAAAQVGDGGMTLLTLRNSPEVTQSIRDARQVLAEKRIECDLLDLKIGRAHV